MHLDVFIRLCLCLHPYLCIRMCMYPHLCNICVSAFICPHFCIRIYLNTFVYPYVCTHICMSVCMHSYLYIRMYALIFICPYVCTHICMSVCFASVSVRTQVCISVFPSICIRVQLMRAVNTKECTPYSTEATMACRIGKYINLPIHFRAPKRK